MSSSFESSSLRAGVRVCCRRSAVVRMPIVAILDVTSSGMSGR